MIRHLSDHSFTSKEPTNPPWKRIHRIIDVHDSKDFGSLNLLALCTYQCKPREGGVQARGGDLTNFEIF